MELSDYLRALRNHWLAVLLIMVGCVAVSASYALTQPKVYAANSTGYVATDAGDNPALASVNDSLAKSKAKSYMAIATSRAAAETVIKDLNLTDSPSELSGRVSASQPQDTVLITLTALAGTPVEAQRLADAWMLALKKQVATIEDPDGTNPKSIKILPFEEAALPGAPVSPNIPRMVLGGLLVGLMLGVAYAMVRNQLDRRIRHSAAVERAFGTPVVGSIPNAPALGRDDSGRTGIAVLSSSTKEADQSAAEAFRKLRTNLQFMSVDDPPRVIVVTSPRPGDGKSTVTANLAAALAASGSDVILVDGDLRRPTVADSFGLVEGAGLTDVLIGRVEVDDVLQQHETLEHLQILAAGGVPPNPSELLGSQTMRTLLGTLSERGTVIVDAPPLLPVTDGAVLTAVSDGAFVVVSAGKTLDTDLAAAFEHLAAVRGQALGVILNGMPAGQVYSSRYRRYEQDEKVSRSSTSPAVGVNA